jgi:hypothetical protein
MSTFAMYICVCPWVLYLPVQAGEITVWAMLHTLHESNKMEKF